MKRKRELRAVVLITAVIVEASYALAACYAPLTTTCDEASGNRVQPAGRDPGTTCQLYGGSSLVNQSNLGTPVTVGSGTTWGIVNSCSLYWNCTVGGQAGQLNTMPSLSGTGGPWYTPNGFYEDCSGT